jgi:RNA polymerase sigma factor (sigma-70 family)
MVRFHAFINAYRKDNASYTYWQDDGTEVTLVAGQGGVTEKWIARLKVWHREERNSMRHGEGKVVSLEAFCEEMEDHSAALVAPDSDPEQAHISATDKRECRKNLRKALSILSPEQRRLYYRARILGEPVSAIARELGIHESSLRERIQRMQKNLKKSL